MTNLKNGKRILALCLCYEILSGGSGNTEFRCWGWKNTDSSSNYNISLEEQWRQLTFNKWPAICCTEESFVLIRTRNGVKFKTDQRSNVDPRCSLDNSYSHFKIIQFHNHFSRDSVSSVQLHIVYNENLMITCFITKQTRPITSSVGKLIRTFISVTVVT